VDRVREKIQKGKKKKKKEKKERTCSRFFGWWNT
jgi:hypothetical protein